MSQFDQFANQGGVAAEGPEEMAEARRVAEEHLRNADYDGHVADLLDGSPGHGKHGSEPPTVEPDDDATPDSTDHSSSDHGAPDHGAPDHGSSDHGSSDHGSSDHSAPATDR